MRGPIDYIVVGFEGNKFDGSILKALADAIDNKIINLVALRVVIKDKEGTVDTIGIADLGDEYLVEFSEKYAQNNEAVTEEDIDEIGDLLAEETAAGILVIEQLWALPLKKAIIDAGGFLLAEGRIHPEAANELEGK